MPRYNRTRSRSVTVKGEIQSWIDWQSSGPPDAISRVERVIASSISDRHGHPVVDSPLVSTQRKGCMEANGYVITQGTSAGGRKYIYKNYGLYSALNPGLALPAPPGWQLDLIAGTNPSRPVITPPEMLQNLIELPKLLRDTFIFLSNPKARLQNYRSVADDYLALKFGWMPFVKDLLDLLDLQKHVIKRSKELQQLYSGKGLRRRLKFGNDTVVSDSKLVLPFESGRSITYNSSLITKRESWGTARWHPTTPPPYHPMDPEWNNHVRKIVLGFTPEGLAKGAWAVIPWTWLLGWFTNIGKYSLLYSNTVPANYSHLNFMSKITLERSLSSPKPEGIRWHVLHIDTPQVTTYRSRINGSGPILPGLSMPFMDIGRLSVLAALAVQRIKR